MAQLTVSTHAGEQFKLVITDEQYDTDSGTKLPPDGFVTFRGHNATVTLHVKTIATIHRVKGDR